MTPTPLPLLDHRPAQPDHRPAQPDGTPEAVACCAPLATAPLGADEAAGLAGVLKALADPSRLRIVSLLAATETGEACVCDLTEPLALSQPTVSHHLKTLVEAGLVRRDKRGVWAYFSLVPGALDGVARVLADGAATSPTRVLADGAPTSPTPATPPTAPTPSRG